MLTGIRTHFNPDPDMAQTLSQWIGCARVIYNGKCDEDRYLRTFASKYLPIGTFTEVNKTASQFKDAELTPWLSDCPSQILRNSATIWANTYSRFFKGLGGRPQRKTKAKGNYIWLTKELFSHSLGKFHVSADHWNAGKPNRNSSGEVEQKQNSKAESKFGLDSQNSTPLVSVIQL
jgi:putative transposase